MRSKIFGVLALVLSSLSTPFGVAAERFELVSSRTSSIPVTRMDAALCPSRTENTDVLFHVESLILNGRGGQSVSLINTGDSTSSWEVFDLQIKPNHEVILVLPTQDSLPIGKVQVLPKKSDPCGYYPVEFDPSLTFDLKVKKGIPLFICGFAPGSGCGWSRTVRNYLTVERDGEVFAELFGGNANP